MDSDPKTYELAYLLPPSVPEEQVLMAAGRLTSLVESEEGLVVRVEAPKKRRLAYPIKKQINTYFGWTSFRMPADHLAQAKKKLKDENLLRFAIFIQEEEPAPLRLQTISRRPRSAQERIPREPERMDEKLDLEALDKKLEEILGK